MTEVVDHLSILSVAEPPAAQIPQNNERKKIIFLCKKYHLATNARILSTTKGLFRYFWRISRASSQNETNLYICAKLVPFLFLKI